MASSSPRYSAYSQSQFGRRNPFASAHPSSDDIDDEGTVDKPILAINCKGKTVGGAFWKPQDTTVVILGDIQCANPIDMIDLVKLQSSAGIVLLSSKVEESFAEALKPNASEEYTLYIRPFLEFSFEKAKQRIVKLAEILPHAGRLVMEIPDTLGDEGGKMIRMGGVIEWNKQISIGCVGALLLYLLKHQPHREDGVEIGPVTGIEMQSLGGGIALQIFQDLSHPSALSNSIVAKRSNEGLSLFSLLSHTHTPQGYAILRQWFLSPLQSVDVIVERQNTIEFFNQNSTVEHVEQIRIALKKMGDVHSGLNAIRRGGYNSAFGRADGSDEAEVREKVIGRLRMEIFVVCISHAKAGLIEFATYAIEIYDIILRLPSHDLSILQKITANVDPNILRQVIAQIKEIVDFEGSTQEQRFTVKRGVSEELDNMRNVYDGMRDLLAHTAQDIAEGLEDPYARLVDVMYFPQMGYLVTVPAGEDGQPVFMLEGWELKFSTDDTVFFKSTEVNELDGFYGDIYTLIVDKEVEIIHHLRITTLRYAPSLSEVSSLLGELDCLLSLAFAAQKYNYMRPIITNENIINIVNGRHPLQDLVVPTFVENDTYLVGGQDTAEQMGAPSVMLLTGANYSGKSVYLKQVALIVFMAHLGSFVPAQSATIGITDKILTRVQTRESVSKVASAFMIDVQQIALALRASTRQSLVIVDEFGKGTESTDGAGLFCAVLEHFLKLGSERPKVLMATHYHGGFVEQTPYIQYAHMEVLLPTDHQSDELVFLYKLRPGLSLSSYGTNCAAFSGIPKEVIDRAILYTRLQSSGENLIELIRGESDEEEKRNLKLAEEVAKKFISWNIEEVTNFNEVRNELARILN